MTAIIAAALLAASPVHAERVEIVRPGDRALACPALADEINALAAAPAPAAPAAKKGHGLLRILGAAAPFVPAVALTRSAVLTNTVGVAQVGLAGSRPGASPPSTPGASPLDQRRERLIAIFEEKRC